MRTVASGYGLIEGPVWDPARGLYFSDVTGGGIFLLDRTDRISTVIERRRGVGGMALHAEGGLVAGGREIAWLRGDTPPQTLLDSQTADNAEGFNDLTTDQTGRIYVGSLGFKVFGGGPMKPGNLYCIDLDGSVRKVSDGVLLTNGLGASPDGKRLYHSDARRQLVRMYEVEPDGSLGHWKAFCAMGEGRVPDGLKVAADGSVWIADAHGGRVAIFEPDGRHRMDLPVPLPMVTSVCFGGDDLRDLYVVTGSRGGPSDKCGTIYRTRVDVAGLPLAPCRVKPTFA
ncbi:MAG: SMP-30/gluconolactonase/LRE family protein [Hyphomicrobiaceae bacterium]